MSGMELATQAIMSFDANKRRRGRPYSLPDEQVKALLANPFATWRALSDVKAILIQAAQEREINTLCSISDWKVVLDTLRTLFPTKST